MVQQGEGAGLPPPWPTRTSHLCFVFGFAGSTWFRIQRTGTAHRVSVSSLEGTFQHNSSCPLPGNRPEGPSVRPRVGQHMALVITSYSTYWSPPAPGCHRALDPLMSRGFVETAWFECPIFTEERDPACSPIPWGLFPPSEGFQAGGMGLWRQLLHSWKLLSSRKLVLFLSPVPCCLWLTGDGNPGGADCQAWQLGG